MENSLTKREESAEIVKDLTKELGEKLAKYRYDKRLTLPALSDKAGVSHVLLSQLEKNTLDNISLNKLIEVAAAVGVRLRISYLKL